MHKQMQHLSHTSSSGKIVIRMKIIVIIMLTCLFALAITFTTFLSEREIKPLFESSTHVTYSVGVNTHLSFSNSVNYTQELCRSLRKSGVDIIRLDVYWWYGNYQMQLAEVDKAV